MSYDIWKHDLSFVVRFNNHFTGTAVSDELPVRLNNTFIRPVQKTDGAGLRQTDGTYRFIDLNPGLHQVLWLPPFMNSYRGWISFEDELNVVLPIENPGAVIERVLWPSPDAVVSPSTTAIRGKLRGDNVTGLEVRIMPDVELSTPFFTLSDRLGEFLFQISNPVTAEDNGLLSLRIEVEAGGRVVTGGGFIPPATGATFPAAVFKVKPGICSRVIFQVT